MFHDELKGLMDEYAHLVYRFTKTFPVEEKYGATSQLRRSALSVVLNYIEGFARRRPSVLKNFLEISFGSLKESAYLVEFSFKENLLSQSDYACATALSDRIGAMLWGTLKQM